jgi:hypothetical protein
LIEFNGTLQKKSPMSQSIYLNEGLIKSNELLSYTGIDDNIIYLPTYSFNNSNLSNNNFNYNYFINDVQEGKNTTINKTLNITSVTENNDDTISYDIHTQLPLFFINRNQIKVPSKVEYAIRRHIPKHLLYDIDKDIDVAIEMCLIFTTKLNSTYFGIKDGSNPSGWKSLRAEYLRELISIHPLAYKKVIIALEYPHAKGQIIECDHLYVKGEKNFCYRLGTNYIGKGIVTYEAKTKEAIGVLNRYYLRTLSASNENPICRNLIKMYGDVTLPTIKQIQQEGKRLTKLDGGYVTKKGKKLKFLNKHPRQYYKDADKLSFVEDAIEIYRYLTDNGFMIPVVGSVESGGRIVDSITLMPSWIRRLIKYKGKTLIECDYVALHPNIAISLYGGKTKFITHGDLASDLNMDVMDVKIEHLSFFNRKVWGMKESPLYKYYSEQEHEMLNNIINEKQTNTVLKKNKHKITSRKMFKMEVDVMTDVIQKLNDESIYVLYVYDALLCSKKDTERVANLMDAIILGHGVNTIAKVSNGKKYNPIAVKLKETKLDKVVIDTIKKSSTKDEKKPKSIEISADLINFNIRIKELLLEKIGNGIELNFIDAVIKFVDGDNLYDKVMLVHDPINLGLKYVTYSYIFGETPRAKVA